MLEHINEDLQSSILRKILNSDSFKNYPYWISDEDDEKKVEKLKKKTANFSQVFPWGSGLAASAIEDSDFKEMPAAKAVAFVKENVKKNYSLPYSQQMPLYGFWFDKEGNIIAKSSNDTILAYYKPTRLSGFVSSDKAQIVYRNASSQERQGKPNLLVSKPNLSKVLTDGKTFDDLHCLFIFGEKEGAYNKTVRRREGRKKGAVPSDKSKREQFYYDYARAHQADRVAKRNKMFAEKLEDPFASAMPKVIEAIMSSIDLMNCASDSIGDDLLSLNALKKCFLDYLNFLDRIQDMKSASAFSSEYTMKDAKELKEKIQDFLKTKNIE